MLHVLKRLEASRRRPLLQATAFKFLPFFGRCLDEPRDTPVFIVEGIVFMKNALLGAAALAVLPLAANAQSMSSLFTPGTPSSGFYIGAEGGANWLLNSNNNTYNTGYAVGGKIGYDFVGPRVEL